MNRTKKIWLTVALVHIALVASGAFQLNLGTGLLQKFNFNYGRLSGSTSGYAFFAPGVGSQLRATFNVFDKAGTKIASVPLEQGKNREADLRVGNIVGWFWRDNPDRKQQRSMVASWSAKIFARYPNAAKVEVVLEEYYLPAMAEFQEGDRPDWKKYYTAKFTRKTTHTISKEKGEET